MFMKILEKNACEIFSFCVCVYFVSRLWQVTPDICFCQKNALNFELLKNGGIWGTRGASTVLAHKTS
jgi:hypothetical protein